MYNTISAINSKRFRFNSQLYNSKYVNMKKKQSTSLVISSSEVVDKTYQAPVNDATVNEAERQAAAHAAERHAAKRQAEADAAKRQAEADAAERQAAAEAERQAAAEAERQAAAKRQAEYEINETRKLIEKIRKERGL